MNTFKYTYPERINKYPKFPPSTYRSELFGILKVIPAYQYGAPARAASIAMKCDSKCAFQLQDGLFGNKAYTDGRQLVVVIPKHMLNEVPIVTLLYLTIATISIMSKDPQEIEIKHCLRKGRRSTTYVVYHLVY